MRRAPKWVVGWALTALSLARCEGCLPPLFEEQSPIAQLPPEDGASTLPTDTPGEPPACARAGACCSDNDCLGNSAGERCINDACGSEPCVSEGSSCGNGGRCCAGSCKQNATCCQSSECLSGQVCNEGACMACGADAVCELGSSCCAGVCMSGGCCSAEDCTNPFQACVGMSCGACTLGGDDCRPGQSCCDDPTLGAICLEKSSCCPSFLSNTACETQSDPSSRACSVLTRTCGACDALNAPCPQGRTCCGGACVSPSPAGPLGSECCDALDCASGACDPMAHVCVECLGAGTCGTPTPATGSSVCDPASHSCVACDSAHACGPNQVCCNGECFAGGCCANSECPPTSPVCDPSVHACRGCTDDAECLLGSVCVDPSGTGSCGGSSCQCIGGSCHEPSAVGPGDCAGACCAYTCFFGADCCGDADCSLPTPGYQPSSVCTSAQSATRAQACGADHRCACPPASGGALYVDGALGDDLLGTGNPACPFKTITRALQVGASYTVNVRPGRYASDESFPLVPLSGTLLQRDPSCDASAGVAAIVRSDASATCPVSGAGSCAIAVIAPSVQLHNLAIKNTSGAAIAFGAGASPTSGVFSGMLGCESALASCKRGGAEGQAAHELIFVGEAAAPTIGPVTLGDLGFAGSLRSALVIAGTSAPLVRNLDALTSFDQDVISVRDAATPTLSNLRIDWGATGSDPNLARCVSVTGSGAGFIFDRVWMQRCGSGGVSITRTHRGADYTFSDVRVNGSLGVPHASGSVNRAEGFGLWLQGGAVVNMSAGGLLFNAGHGAMVRNARLTLDGVLVSANGQQSASAVTCYGGNGLEINDTAAVVVATSSVFASSLGRTSPPPSTSLDPCATGDGVRLGRGSASFTSCSFVANAFDGLLVESSATSASAASSLFSGNGANGVEVQALNANISGNNVFGQCPGPLGNARANLCFVTPIVPGAMRAESNAWMNDPPTVVGDDDPQPEIPGDPEDIVRYASSSNAHCAGLGAPDIAIVSSTFAFPPFIAISSVDASPALAPFVCP